MRASQPHLPLSPDIPTRLLLDALAVEHFPAYTVPDACVKKDGGFVDQKRGFLLTAAK
jgi:hypothetical protein